MVKNYMETVVDNHISKVLVHYENICKCSVCIDDIKAIALNNLPPMYARTKQGEAFNKIKSLSQQFEADVLKELTKAIDIVSSNPRHE